MRDRGMIWGARGRAMGHRPEPADESRNGIEEEPTDGADRRDRQTEATEGLAPSSMWIGAADTLWWRTWSSVRQGTPHREHAPSARRHSSSRSPPTPPPSQASPPTFWQPCSGPSSRPSGPSRSPVPRMTVLASIAPIRPADATISAPFLPDRASTAASRAASSLAAWYSATCAQAGLHLRTARSGPGCGSSFVSLVPGWWTSYLVLLGSGLLP